MRPTNENGQRKICDHSISPVKHKVLSVSVNGGLSTMYVAWIQVTADYSHTRYTVGLTAWIGIKCSNFFGLLILPSSVNQLHYGFHGMESSF